MLQRSLCKALGLLVTVCLAAPAPADESLARGVVFHDQNQNRRLDDGESGIAGVRVSNGREFASTDKNGKYEITIDDETVLFVIKPRNWMSPRTADNLPLFYYVHQPKGSPPDIAQFPGVAPTGPLPKSIDFPLVPHQEPEAYEVLVFGDTQPRDLREVDYIAHDVVEPLIGTTQAAFGVTLGDVVFDDLSIFEPLQQVIGRIGVPWFLVPGNHDLNYDATVDAHSLETWKRLYGPPYYSFDWGSVHWVVLDNVVHEGLVDKRPKYHGAFGKQQLDWLRADLAALPSDQLVVCMMHIPASDLYKNPNVVCSDARDFFNILSDRPHVLTLSAHLHMAHSMFIDQREGWTGAEPHLHFNAGTVCGSWWTGLPDERGIPHATMRDGGPNGHYVLSIQGNRYSIELRPASRPPEDQMSIYAPDPVDRSALAATKVIVNVFNGSSRSETEMRVDGGSWVALEPTSMIDPYYEAMREQQEKLPALPGRRLPAPVNSTHIWTGDLPGGLREGVHTIEVRTRDLFGHTYTGRRVIRVQ